MTEVGIEFIPGQVFSLENLETCIRFFYAEIKNLITMPSPKLRPNQSFYAPQISEYLEKNRNWEIFSDDHYPTWCQEPYDQVNASYEERYKEKLPKVVLWLITDCALYISEVYIQNYSQVHWEMELEPYAYQYHPFLNLVKRKIAYQ